MADLSYRGARVIQEDAVKQDHIASYRGVTYHTKAVEAMPVATSGTYRGSSWKS